MEKDNKEIHEVLRKLIGGYLHMGTHENTNVADYGNKWANYWLAEAANKYGLRFNRAEIELMKKGEH